MEQQPKSIDQGFAIIPLIPHKPTDNIVVEDAGATRTIHVDNIVISPNNDPQKSISATMRDNDERAFFAFATELDKYTHLVSGSYSPVSYTHLTLPTKA